MVGDPTPADLAGDWSVDRIGGTPVVDGSTVALALLEDGTLAGDTSVNRVNGRWTLDADGVEFLTPLATTRRAGPPALMEQEQRFLDALSRVVGAALEDGRLVLRDAAGAEILRASR